MPQGKFTRWWKQQGYFLLSLVAVLRLQIIMNFSSWFLSQHERDVLKCSEKKMWKSVSEESGDWVSGLCAVCPTGKSQAVTQGGYCIFAFYSLVRNLLGLVCAGIFFFSPTYRLPNKSLLVGETKAFWI